MWEILWDKESEFNRFNVFCSFPNETIYVRKIILKISILQCRWSLVVAFSLFRFIKENDFILSKKKCGIKSQSLRYWLVFALYYGVYWPVYQRNVFNLCLNNISYWDYYHFHVVLLTKIGEDALTQHATISETNIKCWLIVRLKSEVWAIP